MDSSLLKENNQTQTNNASLFCLSSKHLFDSLQENYSIICLVLGSFGNIMSFMVLVQTKIRRHSTFTYLILLSVCEFFVLHFGLLRDYLVLKYDVHVYGTALCKLHTFTFYLLLHMSSWLLVAVNIDRLIASSFLVFSKVWCKPRRALHVSLGLTIALSALNSHFLFFVESINTVHNDHDDDQDEMPVNPYVYQKCVLKTRHYIYFFQNIFTWIDTACQVIMPFGLMIICNFSIIRNVLVTSKKTKTKDTRRKRKIKGMCIIIVSLSVIFFLLELPVLVFVCLLQASMVSINNPCIEMLWILTNMMMYTNHSINFFLYCMTGSIFRKELVNMSESVFYACCPSLAYNRKSRRDTRLNSFFSNSNLHINSHFDGIAREHRARSFDLILKKTQRKLSSVN